MAINNAKEFFVFLLSDLRQGAERTTKIFHEIGKFSRDRDIKEAIDARVFVSNKILATLDKAFKLIGAAPVKMSGRLYDVFVEDFRRELAEIRSPKARRLYILAKASHLIHLRIGEYAALISAADVSGHYGVGILLESCLADKVGPGEDASPDMRTSAERRRSSGKPDGGRGLNRPTAASFALRAGLNL